MIASLPLLAKLEFNLVIPGWLSWLLIPMFIAILVMIVLLYAGQRRLAPRKTVLTLTAIRLALLLLIAILLLQPVERWNHEHTTAGTLWFLIDQSPSMQTTDPQASPIEHIHWAEALGYLSKSARPSTPDFTFARFLALEGDFASLRPSSDAFASPAANPQEEAPRVNAFASRLSDWAKAANKFRDDASSELSSAPSGPSIQDALNRIVELAESGALCRQIRSLPLRRRFLGQLDALQANLDIAHKQLESLTSIEEADFVRSHGSDSNIATAAARVTNVSRADLAQLFLTTTEKRTSKNLLDILPNYRVRIATFASNTQIAGTVDPASFADTLKSALLPAGGNSPDNPQSTNIASGLQSIAEQIAPDEPANVIIVTDGRHNVPSDPTEPARSLAARNVRVFGLLVGSHEVSADAAVEQIDAPEWVYRGDTLRAALIRLDGLNGQTARVEFRRGDTLLNTQTVRITSNQQTERLEFTDQPPDTSAGLEYEVHVLDMPGETNLQNNHSTFRVAVKKDKLYALVIENRPRWEYRYVAAYLSRDQRIKLQTVLLNPASIDRITPPDPVKASPENPQTEAQILPQTKEEWMAFDIFVLGDIGPDTLSNDQQQFLSAAVRDKGATLITIAGHEKMPQTFANSPLAELLPVTLVPQYDAETISRHAHFGFRPALAPEGATSVLAQFGLDADANAALWSNLPLWYWHSSFTQAKPSASVIWSISEPGRASILPRSSALLATMTVGLGHSLYLASDQTWRLRQVYGENVHERFWGQVLRWAVGSDLPAGGKFVRFGSSQSTYAQGQPVTITARILREDLTPYTGLTFSARAVPANSTNAATQPSTEARFVESPESPGYYHATLGGLPAGNIEISLQGSEVERLLDTDPSVTQKTLTIKILPQLNLEQRNMNTDPGLLARVTQAGGGYSLDANYADILAENLPESRRIEHSTEEIGFFTDPKSKGTTLAHLCFLLLFALLITAEWIIRKRAGLV